MLFIDDTLTAVLILPAAAPTSRVDPLLANTDCWSTAGTPSRLSQSSLQQRQSVTLAAGLAQWVFYSSFPPYNISLSSQFLSSRDSTDTVYVTDRNHCVSAFTTRGQFLKCFGEKGSGEGELSHPGGIAVDNTSGNICVCDRYNGRVVVY